MGGELHAGEGGRLMLPRNDPTPPGGLRCPSGAGTSSVARRELDERTLPKRRLSSSLPFGRGSPFSLVPEKHRNHPCAGSGRRGNRPGA